MCQINILKLKYNFYVFKNYNFQHLIDYKLGHITFQHVTDYKLGHI